MATIYLSLGSNLGDRQNYLRLALEELKKIGTIEAVSSVYATEPVDYREQPWFLNIAIKMTTTKSAPELLADIHKIEGRLGRERSVLFGPRTIDIDILLYDTVVLNTEALTLPHPRLTERRFVLTPMAEIAPDVVHPVLKKNMTLLLTELTEVRGVEKQSDLSL